MIAFEELLGRFVGLDRRELTRWVENRWVLPERRNETWIFREIDVARVELILEVRREFAIDTRRCRSSSDCSTRSTIYDGSSDDCATRLPPSRRKSRRPSRRRCPAPLTPEASP